MSQNEYTAADFFARAVRETVPADGAFRFIARGGSMQPVIRDGDTVRARRVGAGELKTGDIIVAEYFGHMRVHRLIRKENRDGAALLRTQGDSLYYEDEPLMEDRLLGVVAVVEKRDGTTVRLETRRARISGFFFLASGFVKRMTSAIFRLEVIRVIKGRKGSMARRVRMYAYKCFAHLPYRILAGAKECESE
ncbi:S24/S26 family peptidase [bacterium]